VIRLLTGPGPSLLSDVLRPIAVAAAAAYLATCHTGCSPYEMQTPATAERAYTKALLTCVQQSKTQSESRACRARVNAEFRVCEGAEWPKYRPCGDR
jgi:hypothetical protein